jgi:hypothetical protein
MKHFIDFAFGSLNKAGEELCGDKVEFHRAEDSVIAVLSDGLGSGVKANILSTLTAKIAITMLKEGLSIEEVVDTVIHTLPVCQVRKLAYSTFTIVKIDKAGNVYAVEFDNPSMFFIHDGKIQELKSKLVEINGRRIKESSFVLQEGDTLIFVSDGVIHAGAGNVINLGWGWKEVAGYIERVAADEQSSKAIANQVLKACDALYIGKPGDDTTVVAMKMIRPKEAALFAGPPQSAAKDVEVVKKLLDTKGIKIVCGGTAANIVSRELKEEIETSFEIFDRAIPPTAKIKGIDLVTEGVLTVKGAVKRLERVRVSNDLQFLNGKDGASRLAKMLFEECTHLKMLIGRAVNPAHQNPDFPEELSIKLRVLKELKEVLESLGKIVEMEFY